MRVTSTLRGGAALACAALLTAVPVSAAAQRTAVAGSARRGRAMGRPFRTTLAVRGIVEGEDLVRTARQYLGVPYRLGGETPRAFDCSGFVRYVFAEYGIVLPRTAHEQAALGRAPFPGDLRPGDLLFFYGGRGAQHIALYVGRDTIIHASSRGRHVRLDVLPRAGGRRSWFTQRLIAVRRVAPAEGYFYLPTTVASSSAATRHLALGPPGARRPPTRPQVVSVVPLVY